MEKFDYGPLRTYEIVWRSGHVETVQGHQVTFTGGGDLFGRTPRPVRFRIHGMFPGEDWRMVLCGLEEDVVTIRDVTEGERITPDAAGGAS